MPYFLDLLLETDCFDSLMEEKNEHINPDKFPSKHDSSKNPILKPEEINQNGITFLKPRLIELTIEIFFKNPVKISVYDSNSKKIEAFIEKEIKRLEIMNFKQTDKLSKYFTYFFQSFLNFVIYYYHSLENKDFFEGEDSESHFNIFKNLAITVKQHKIIFKNILNDSQMALLKQLFDIAKVQDDEKYYKSNIFHSKSFEEFEDQQIKETEEYENIVKEVEEEKMQRVEEDTEDKKIRMIGNVKRGRVFIESSKNKHQNLWKIFKKELLSSETLSKVFLFL